MTNFSNYTILVFFFLTFNYLAQGDTMGKGATKSFPKFYGWEYHYGKFYPKINSLNKQLFDKYNSSISSPQLVGLSLKCHLNVFRIDDRSKNVNSSYEYIIPTTIYTDDTMKIKFTGYHWGIMLYGIDLLRKNAQFDFILGAGFNSGRHVIEIISNDKKSNYKNPLFSPKLTSELRAIFGRISIGVRAEYQWDTSKGVWRTDQAQTFSPANSKFSGLIFQGFVGVGRNY